MTSAEFVAKSRDVAAKTWDALTKFFPLARYIFERAETHGVCGFVAFFALIGFYPFLTLLLSMMKYALKWDAAYNVIVESLRDYYPIAQDFLITNLEASVVSHGKTLDAASLVMVLIGAAGIFIVEIEFNKIWNFAGNRSYLKNQIIGLFLTFCCLALTVGFAVITATVQSVAEWMLPQVLEKSTGYLIFRLFAIVFSSLIIFFIYRLLPNGKVETEKVLPAAILAGVFVEIVRGCYSLLLGFVNMKQSHGPFYVSVAFCSLVYFETFVLLAGAFIAAQNYPWMHLSQIRSHISRLRNGRANQGAQR